MDLYELLGLARGATLIEIKRSYRRLARKSNPDITPGDNAAEARFRESTRAYETLADPERLARFTSFVTRPVATLERRVYQRADMVLAKSEWAAESLLVDYGVDPLKVRVHAFAILSQRTGNTMLLKKSGGGEHMLAGTQWSSRFEVNKHLRLEGTPPILTGYKYK